MLSAKNWLARFKSAPSNVLLTEAVDPKLLQDLKGQVAAINRSQGVIEFELDGTIITANQNFLDVVGYTLDEIKGRHHSMFVDEAEKGSAEYKAFWKALNSGEFKQAEFKRIGKGGREAWIQATYNPLFDSKGKAYKVVKFATDITPEITKRNEFATLSLVANETDNSVVITDGNERIEYVNPGFTKMTGYTFAEVKGRKPGEVLQGKLTDPATRMEIREALKAGRPHYCEILNYHKNGDTYWVSLALNPIRGQNGKIERIVSVQSNITATKQRAFEASTEIKALRDTCAFIEFMPDGTIISCNEPFARATGYAESEIKGRHHRMFVDDATRCSTDYAQLWKRLSAGEPQAGQYTRWTKSGKVLYLNAAYTPIKDIVGNVTKVVKYATDVTEQVIAAHALQNAVSEVKSAVAAAASSDLTKRTPMDGKTGEIAELCAGVNGLLDTMSGVISNIASSSGVIASASRELAVGNTELSQRTEEQAASLEETAASLGEFTTTVKQNAENAQKANDLATAASQVAIKGGQVVAEVISTMDGISQASRKIADIIGVIDEISFQTNILALNAAVEAARAGEQGRGFAVVASEVRSLAQRSTNAAKEIKTLISDSVARVETGAKLVESAGKTMEDLVSGVEGVSRIMADISAASREQSEGIEQVNTAVMQMDKITQQNAALVEEAAAAAKSMEEQTATLESVVASFQIADGGARSSLGAPRRPAVAATGNPVVDKAFRKAGGPPAPRPATAKPAVRGASASKPALAPVKRAVASGGGRDDWTEF